MWALLVLPVVSGVSLRCVVIWNCRQAIRPNCHPLVCLEQVKVFSTLWPRCTSKDVRGAGLNCGKALQKFGGCFLCSRSRSSTFDQSRASSFPPALCSRRKFNVYPPHPCLTAANRKTEPPENSLRCPRAHWKAAPELALPDPQVLYWAPT